MLFSIVKMQMGIRETVHLVTVRLRFSWFGRTCRSKAVRV